MAVLTLLGPIWAGSLYLWPFGPCLRCKGSGRNKGSTGRRYGECRSLQGQRTPPPHRRQDHPPRHRQPRRQGPRPEGREVA
jgi:hypothetical protein